MARQMIYAGEDVDTIQPRNEQERRVLELAVKHGLISPMAWDTPPTHFGRNRPTWAELCAFAADIAGVGIPRRGDQPMDPQRARELADPSHAAFEEALRQTWQMVDPIRPPKPGTYALGEHNGVCAALKTLRQNYERLRTTVHESEPSTKANGVTDADVDAEIRRSGCLRTDENRAVVRARLEAARGVMASQEPKEKNNGQ